MPYKDPKRQKAAMNEIIRRLREREREKRRQLEDAIRNGNLPRAREILDTKRIDVFGKTWQNLCGKQTGTPDVAKAIFSGTVGDSKTRKTRRKR